MKRYNIEEDAQRPGYNFWHPAIIEEESPDGEWVKADEAEDIEEERDQLRARVAELEAEVERLKEAVEDRRTSHMVDHFFYEIVIAAYEQQSQADLAALERMRERVGDCWRLRRTDDR